MKSGDYRRHVGVALNLLAAFSISSESEEHLVLDNCV